MQGRPAHDMGWNVHEKGISVGRVAPPSHSLDCTLPFSVLRTDEDRNGAHDTHCGVKELKEMISIEDSQAAYAPCPYSPSSDTP